MGPEQAPLNKAELEKIEEIQEEYYQENWSKVLVKFLRYAQPSIANAQAMSHLTLEVKPPERIYFHAAWLKPGRNTYVIEQMKFETEVHSTLKDPQSQTSKPLFDLIEMLDGRDSPNLKLLENNRDISDRNFYVH